MDSITIIDGHLLFQKVLQQSILQLLFAYPSYFKEIATLTAASASGRTTYCSVSIGHSEEVILQAWRLDQAPIIHQVTSAVTLIRADTQL